MNHLEAMGYAPGVYRLTMDIKNPHPHKGRRSWVYNETWKAGQLFLLDHYRYAAKEGAVRPRLRALCWNANPSSDYILNGDGHGTGDDAFDHLMAGLQGGRQSETLGSVLAQSDDSFNRTWILAVLLESGQVSLDGIKAALSQLEHQDDADPEDTPKLDALLVKHGLSPEKGVPSL